MEISISHFVVEFPRKLNFWGAFEKKHAPPKFNFLGNSTTKCEISISPKIQFLAGVLSKARPLKVKFFGELYHEVWKFKFHTSWLNFPENQSFEGCFKKTRPPKVKLFGGVLFKKKTFFERLTIGEIRPRSVKFKFRTSWSNFPKG